VLEWQPQSAAAVGQLAKQRHMEEGQGEGEQDIMNITEGR
jgi:hypothetical protein